jgi:hypothetical protein
MHLIVEIKVEG